MQEGICEWDHQHFWLHDIQELQINMLYTILSSSGKGTQDYGLLLNESNGI